MIQPRFLLAVEGFVVVHHSHIKGLFRMLTRNREHINRIERLMIDVICGIGGSPCHLFQLNG